MLTTMWKDTDSTNLWHKTDLPLLYLSTALSFLIECGWISSSSNSSRTSEVFTRVRLSEKGMVIWDDGVMSGTDNKGRPDKGLCVCRQIGGYGYPIYLNCSLNIDTFVLIFNFFISTKSFEHLNQLISSVYSLKNPQHFLQSSKSHTPDRPTWDQLARAHHYSNKPFMSFFGVGDQNCTA